MSEHDEPLPDGVRDRLAEAYGTDRPDDRVRERTLAALRRQGAFPTGSRGAPRRAFAAAAAAAGLLLFLGGFWLGSARPAAGPPADAANLYLMLLHEPVGGLTVEGMSEADFVAEYGAWAGRQAAAGNLVRGEKLGVRTVLLGGGRTPADLGATVVTGFFLLRATDLDEASAIAGTCPHVVHGGTVELRPIDPT